MKKRINSFIRAHGADPGPLMRPRLTGFLSSFAAGLILMIPLLRTESLVPRFSAITVSLIFFAYISFSGLLYGQIYRRAANDPRGGWLFGASTGFILWMINPLIWLPWLGHAPLFVGTSALIFLSSHVIHGFLMGLFYPWMHMVCRRRQEQDFY